VKSFGLTGGGRLDLGRDKKGKSRSDQRGGRRDRGGGIDKKLEAMEGFKLQLIALWNGTQGRRKDATTREFKRKGEKKRAQNH